MRITRRGLRLSVPEQASYDGERHSGRDQVTCVCMPEVGFNAVGLPVGVQIVGPNHGEMSCLQLAYAYDQATGWVNRQLPTCLSEEICSPA